MCIFCLIKFVGEAAVNGAAGACGMRQGEYAISDHDGEVKPKHRDWRSVLCCCSQSGKLAERSNMVFLHGVLYLDIIEGKDLPDVDTSIFRSAKDVSDPYVTVDTCKGGKRSCRICKTSIIFNSLNPHWGEHFRIEVCHEAESLLFSIKDMDLIKVESIGYMSIRAEDLLSEEPITGWFPLISKGGNPCGSLNINLHYRSSSSITRSNEVPDTVFPLHSGCRVTLYQDAHTPAISPVTDVILPDGENYQPPQLWVDISNYLEAAESFIYIIGWSVKAEIPLLRDPDGETLGELLVRKAGDGVRVLIMVWNEALSTDIYTPGVMGTHDEETRIYFEGTGVEVLLAPRSKSKARLFETNYVSTLYTHHQKCVITDAPVDGESRRRLVAFVGGLDLTDGRWDTPEHPLYRTLHCEHVRDFYNGTCSTTSKVGPRQPWHDIHALVEGSVVMDLVRNFVERWRKQAPERENRLISIDESNFVLNWKCPSPSFGVQLFRSINSDSAMFHTSTLDKLLSRKGRLFDSSIQRAYIHHIRRAKHFLYIENQYFLGSSHGWLIQEAKCPNLIPAEIAVRIINAIKAREDFRAYIVIPLHPEGDPSSTAVQEILHWQYRTMDMMYRRISKALRKVGSSAHPTDYLSFFCLGKREALDELPQDLDEPDEGSVAAKARRHMRFMIYVHSKMAIFDDEYTLIGSANINERSLSGNRDTEMAVGLYEEGYTKEESGDTIQGRIQAFRLALWAEHCGAHSEKHKTPSDYECMKELRELGEDNLQHFLSQDPEHRDSHLLLYPINVSDDGHVTRREDCPKFPDTSAPVLGKSSNFLPNSLTT
ncbi:UNVERIFIED_CONTAM: hypothetical protein RMT77_003536 [Armadillidium vulgare]